jgi:hypothetical protein
MLNPLRGTPNSFRITQHPEVRIKAPEIDHITLLTIMDYHGVSNLRSRVARNPYFRNRSNVPLRQASLMSPRSFVDRLPCRLRDEQNTNEKSCKYRGIRHRQPEFLEA